VGRTSNHRINTFSITAAIMLAVLASTANAGSAPQSTLVRDYLSGVIDRDTYYLHLMQSVLQPEALPDKYASSFDVRCGTHVLSDVASNLETLSPELQAMYQVLDTRPTTQFQLVSADSLFRLHYDTLSGQQTPPVPTEDLDSNQIPDFIENMASYADSAWRQIVTGYGYHRPPSDGTLGGDSLYDLYFDQFQFYGVTNADNPGPEPWDDFSSHIVLNRAFDIFPPNQDPEGNQKGSMKVAIAHELYHAVQFYYDAYLNDWWMEQTAVWMEDEVFPGIHDNYNYFDEFWPVPQVSLLEEDDYWHMYGAFVWPKYLSQAHGNGLIMAILKGMATPSSSLLNVFSDTLGEYGTDFHHEFREFLYWNYMTGARDDGFHYEDGVDYPGIEILKTHTVLPSLNNNSLAAPYNLGSNYIEAVNDSGYVGILAFKLDTAYAASWELAYITCDSAGNNDYGFRTLSGSGVGTLYIGSFQDYDRVVLIPFVKGTSPAGPYGYTYSLYFRPMGDADQSETVDIDDAIWIISYIFTGGPASSPYIAMDADCNGGVDIDDVVYIITYIFASGPPPCGEGFD
jgi:hypothetical protein